MPDIFVPPQSIATEAHDYTIIDVRREGEYDEYIPGAVYVPFERFRDPGDETPGKLPSPDAFASLLSEAGVGSDDRIVAYDAEYGVYASRFLVTAEVFGHDPDRLHLLDGDIESWSRTHRTTTRELDRRRADYRCRRGANGQLVTAAELDAALDGDAVIVDTRDPLEYDTVHLPDAVNLQWRDLVDEERRRLKPVEDRQSILAAHGIRHDRPVRLYCNTARRLSFVYAILRELDHPDVAFYEGGIGRWAEYGGPVATSPS